MEIFLIVRKTWKHEVRIATLVEIKEGIRQLFDKTSEHVRAVKDEIEKLFQKAELPKDLLGLLDVVRTLKPGQSPKELADEINAARKEIWEAKIKELVEMKHGDNRRKERKELEKTANEILKLYTILAALELDVSRMEEQMEGEWSEKRQRKEGGLDQEIATLRSNIKAGVELGKVITHYLNKNYWVLKEYE